MKPNCELSTTKAAEPFARFTDEGASASNSLRSTTRPAAPVHINGLPADVLDASVRLDPDPQLLIAQHIAKVGCHGSTERGAEAVGEVLLCIREILRHSLHEPERCASNGDLASAPSRLRQIVLECSDR